MIARGWLRKPPLLGAGLDRTLAARLTWSELEMREWAMGRLGRRLELARSVPAWRGTLESLGSALPDLEKLPLLDRELLAEDPSRYCDPRWPRPLLRSARTSGSTGRPLTVLRDPASVLLEEAFLRRQLTAYGWSGGVSLAIRAEGPLDPAAPPVARAGTRNEWCVAASRLDDRTVRAVVQHGAAYRVGLLRGYPSALTELARRIDALGLRDQLAAWPLTLLHLSSETVTPAAVSLLRRVFGVPVAEQYGQAERALLIQTCPVGSRHLVTDYGWGEVVGGEWIGTPLHGAMVLLRYRTGDGAERLSHGPRIAPAASCECGWPYPVVGAVDGRADAYVETHDRRRVGRLGPALRAPSGVAWVQVEQQPDRILHVRFGALPGHAPDEIGRALEKSLRDLLRDREMRMVLLPGVEPVRDPSGKVRTVRQRDQER